MSLPVKAARLGIEKFREYLELITELDEKDKKGRTAVFRVSRLGRYEHLFELTQRCADVNKSDCHDEAPLSAAARYGHLECVKLLLDFGALLNNCPDPRYSNYPETALCSAVRHNCYDVVKFLLEASADPRIGYGNYQPIISSVCWSEIRILDLLAKYNIELDCKGDRGMTALHYAVEKGDVDKINRLLSLGADINATDDQGRTPIMCAIDARIRVGDPIGDPMPTIYCMMKYQPNLEMKDHSGEGLASRAVRFELDELIEFLGSVGLSKEVDLESNRLTSEQEISLTVDGDYDVYNSNDEFYEDDEGLEISQFDYEVANNANRAKPNLLSYLGWRASKNHWRILCCLDEKPLPLVRVAYFARGWFNVESGRELDDAEGVLDEPYLEAIERFISEGLVEKASVQQSLELGLKIVELKKHLRSLDVKISGTKSDLVRRFMSHADEGFIDRLVESHQHYTLTEKGRNILVERESECDANILKLRNDITSSLADREYSMAVGIARVLNLCLGYEYDVSARQVALTRKIMESGLEPYARGSAYLCSVAGAAALLSFPGKWTDWGIIRESSLNSSDPGLSLSSLLNTMGRVS